MRNLKKIGRLTWDIIAWKNGSMQPIHAVVSPLNIKGEVMSFKTLSVLIHDLKELKCSAITWTGNAGNDPTNYKFLKRLIKTTNGLGIKQALISGKKVSYDDFPVDFIYLNNWSVLKRVWEHGRDDLQNSFSHDYMPYLKPFIYDNKVYGPVLSDYGVPYQLPVCSITDLKGLHERKVSPWAAEYFSNTNDYKRVNAFVHDVFTGVSDGSKQFFI